MLVKKRQAGFSLIELMIVVMIGLVIAAFSVPGFLQALRNYRIGGDSQAIKNEILLAKMRAAANFTRSRVFFQRSNRTFRTQLWNKETDAWEDVDVGAPQPLSSGVAFGFGDMTTPPPGTQAALGFASGCMTGSAGNPGGGTAIGGTACTMFNSRGFPVDNGGAATGENAIYITDSESVQGATIIITGVIQTWRAELATDTWVER